MSALSSLLVQDQILTVTQIEKALQRQVIFGGDLATNLLELGLVGEDVLLGYIGRVVRHPVLPSGHLEHLEPAIIKMIPWQTVYERRVLPVRIHGNTLVVAAAAPLAADVVEQLAAELGVAIAAHVVAEFRLGMALNRYYGIPLPARLATLQRRYAPDFVVDQQPVVPPPSTDPGTGGPPPRPGGQVGQSRIVRVGEQQEPEAPSQPVLLVESSHPLRDEADTTMKFITRGARPAATGFGPRTARQEPIVEVVGGTDQLADARSARDAPIQIKFSEALAMLDDARDRDEILDIFLNFAGQAFEFTALFFVQGRVAHGRAAMSRWSNPFGIEHLTIPLDQGGMFETVFQTRGFHLGPPSRIGSDATALHRLQRAHPKNCTLLPVLLRQRIILLLYGDSGNRGVRANRVARLADFARAVGAAFERIVLKQKYREYRKAEPTAPPKARKVDQPTVSMAPPSRSAVEGSAGLWGTRGASSEGKIGLADRARFGVRDEELIGADTWPEPSKPSIPAPAGEPEPTPDEAGARAAEAPPADPPEPQPDRQPEPDPAAVDPQRDTVPAYYPGGVPVTAPDPALVERVQTVTIPALSTLPPAAAALRPSPELVARVQLLEIPASTEPPVERKIPALVSAVDSLAPTEPPPPLDDEDANLDTLPPPPATDGEPQPELAATVEPLPEAIDEQRGAPMPAATPEEIEALVERVLARGRFDEEAAQRLVASGDAACAELVRHFPGPLSYDRYQQMSRLRGVDQHGPLLRTLVMTGGRAVPFLLPLLDSLDSEIRFYATFLFTAIKHPDALAGLAQRIFDNDRQIRALALDVLRSHDHFPEHQWTMRELAGTLVSPGSSLETKRITAEALGELRTPVAVRALAEMLGSVDGVLAERCQRALVKIAFDDFGFSERRWLNWWDANRGRHRIEWGIDSLTHRTEAIRNAALEELRQMVGDAVPWPTGPMDHRQRRDLKQLCEQWWEREGRMLHPVRVYD